MPVILATQEAEIRRIAVQSQPGQIVHKTPSQKNTSQKRAGELSSNPSTRKKKERKPHSLFYFLRQSFPM
jgi:hypothetical protein